MTTEPKNIRAVPAKRHLTMAERIAVDALMADQARVQARMRELFADMGLDPAKSYKVEPDGTVEAIE